VSVFLMIGTHVSEHMWMKAKAVHVDVAQCASARLHFIMAHKPRKEPMYVWACCGSLPSTLR